MDAGEPRRGVARSDVAAGARRLRRHAGEGRARVFRPAHGPGLCFNLSQLRHVTETGGAAPADTLRSFGHAEEIRPEDEIARRPPLGRLLRALPDLARVVVNTLRAEHIF